MLDVNTKAAKLRDLNSRGHVQIVLESDVSRNSFDASLISNNVKCPKTLLVDKKKAV